jgi:hypothetical protein
MDDLEFLRENVPQFEGYADELARHRTDQCVRAWAGSMLADVQARFAGSLAPNVAELLSATIVRCQFPDQTFTTRLDVADVTHTLEEALAQIDRQLVELADRAAMAPPDELAPILRDIDAAFDRRRQRVPEEPSVP